MKYWLCYNFTSRQSVEVQITICAHDHLEKVLSVSIEARTAIDKMFKVVKTIRPKTILYKLLVNFLIFEKNLHIHLLQNRYTFV
jgi:hypothetical protein